tara:strand:- start:3664 stop:4209 length:546 start_codon:yes stop_codon:yes gene_type:complete
MASIITPTLNITANNKDYATTASAGPMSMSLSLSTTKAISVDYVMQGMLETSTTPTELFNETSGHDIMTAHGSDTWTLGTVGGYLYLKHTATSGTDRILIGIVSNHNPAGSSDPITGSDTPAAPAASGDGNLAAIDNTTLRTMTLLPGEFAFFPWDYTGRIFVENTAGSHILEWWLFDRLP